MSAPVKHVFVEGQVFARLVVVGAVCRRRIGDINVRVVPCRCICGALIDVAAHRLTAGITRSCGCLHRERLVSRNRRHDGWGTPEYRIWQAMKQRCSEPQQDNWKYYGGRGIAVCDRWLDSFTAFLADMGRRPSSKHSIDRINNDGHYTPQNCRWATAIEQRANRRPQVNSRRAPAHT